MVAIPQISQQMFYIIIAVIAAIGIIIALIQFIRIRRAKKQLKLLNDETRQKKLGLVKRDLNSRGIKTELILKGQKQEIPPLETSDIIEIPKISDNNIYGRIKSFESKKEYLKVQELLTDIEKREIEFENQEKKFEIDNEELKRKISKFNWRN